MKKSQRAILIVAAGGIAAVSIAALVVLSQAFFTQDAGQVAPMLEKDNDENKDVSRGNSSAGTGPAGKITAAAATTSLQCHDDTAAAGADEMIISATLADRSSGRGIPGKQVVFTILPGNPVAVLPTDGSGKASLSLNATEFSNREPAVFAFFDGDKEYEFSSCRIDIVKPPQAAAGD